MSNLIVNIVSEHSCDIKTLFDVLGGVLHEVKLDFIKDKDIPIEKPKNIVARKKSRKSSSDEDDSDDSDDSDDDRKKKTKKNVKKDRKKNNNNNKESSDEDSESEEEEKPKKQSGKGGIRILALDENQTLMIYIKLNSEHFVTFDVKFDNYSVGLDLTLLQKFLRTVDKDSIMTLSIDKDNEQEIMFSLENNAKQNAAKYTQKILDIDDDAKKLPEETSFELSVAMDTSDFHKICREMSLFADYVEITCTNKEITFKCQGDSNAYAKTFKHSDSGVRIMCLNEKKNIIVQAIYELKSLVVFSKCVHLSDEMLLYLKNDWPLFIHYMIGSLGKMLVGLSPVDEKRIKKDKDYDDKFDKYYPDKKLVVKK